MNSYCWCGFEIYQVMNFMRCVDQIINDDLSIDNDLTFEWYSTHVVTWGNKVK